MGLDDRAGTDHTVLFNHNSDRAYNGSRVNLSAAIDLGWTWRCVEFRRRESIVQLDERSTRILGYDEAELVPDPPRQILSGKYSRDAADLAALAQQRLAQYENKTVLQRDLDKAQARDLGIAAHLYGNAAAELAEAHQPQHRHLRDISKHLPAEWRLVSCKARSKADASEHCQNPTKVATKSALPRRTQRRDQPN